MWNNLIERNEYKSESDQTSVMVFDKMKESAELQLCKSVTHAAVTVSANFNSAQRKVLIDAGIIARLKVLHIIYEPATGTIGVDINRTSGRKNVLVYKLDGGSFDVTFMSIDAGEMLATNGNTHLGGDDFTLRVKNHLIDLYKTKNGANIWTTQNLRLETEKAKLKLCLTEAWNTRIESLLDFFPSDSTFDQMKLASTISTIQRVLDGAHINKEDIDHIILDGLTPQIRQSLKEFFGDQRVLFNFSKGIFSVGTAKKTGTGTHYTIQHIIFFS